MYCISTRVFCFLKVKAPDRANACRGSRLRAMTNTLRDLARLTRQTGEVPSKQLSAFAEQLERFDKAFVTSFI